MESYAAGAATVGMDHICTEQKIAPGLFKLGACLIYEALTLIALSFVFAGLFVWLTGDATHGIKRLLLQLFLWLAIGGYYVRCWLKTGQTLAMQAWRLRLVNQENALLDFKTAILRYTLTTFSLMLLGVGFLWALVDRDRLFLHDRLLKSRIIMVQKNSR